MCAKYPLKKTRPEALIGLVVLAGLVLVSARYMGSVKQISFPSGLAGSPALWLGV